MTTPQEILAEIKQHGQAFLLFPEHREQIYDQAGRIHNYRSFPARLFWVEKRSKAFINLSMFRMWEVTTPDGYEIETIGFEKNFALGSHLVDFQRAQILTFQEALAYMIAQVDNLARFRGLPRKTIVEVIHG